MLPLMFTRPSVRKVCSSALDLRTSLELTIPSASRMLMACSAHTTTLSKGEISCQGTLVDVRCASMSSLMRSELSCFTCCCPGVSAFSAPASRLIACFVRQARWISRMDRRSSLSRLSVARDTSCVRRGSRRTRKKLSFTARSTSSIAASCRARRSRLLRLWSSLAPIAMDWKVAISS